MLKVTLWLLVLQPSSLLQAAQRKMEQRAQKVQLPAELALSFSCPRRPIYTSTYFLMARIYLHLAAFVDYENMMFPGCTCVEIMYRVRALKF